MEENSLSIEETNKLRIAAGLKPLNVEKEDTAEEKAQKNYKELQEEQAQKQQEQDIKDRIEKSKNRRERFAKLEGKGLGEANDDDEDTASFAKRLEKLKAAKQSKSKKSSGQSNSYNEISQDLNVRHDLNDFSEGQEVILTLADKDVLDEEEDQLVNVMLEEREKTQRNLDNKKGKSLHNAYDEEELLLGNSLGKKRSILSKYDEPLDGFTHKKGFKLNSDPKSVLASLDQDSDEVFRPKGQAISLNEISTNDIDDYYSKEEAEVTFKKLKKKKKSKSKTKSKREHESDEEEDIPYIAPLDNYVDDDDLQQSLARTRSKAIKKFKFSEESLAEKVAKNSDFDIQEPEGGLVLSATSEFVNNLQFSTPETTTKPAPVESEKPESTVASSPEATNTTISPEPSTKEKSPSPEPVSTANFIEEEPLVSKGLGATLDFLTKRGLYQKPTLEQIKRDELSKKRERWALEQKKADRFKELDGYDERSSSRERYSSRDASRDRRSKSERDLIDDQVDMMKDYQPSFKLEYKDAAGNVLNSKEAYRQLSHRFHGKSSGLKKTEKRLKQQEDQKKLESMSISGAQSGLAEALAKKQKETGQAHFILKDSK